MKFANAKELGGLFVEFSRYLVDPRFILSPLVEDVHTGNLVAYLTYHPEGSKTGCVCDVCVPGEYIARLNADLLRRWIRTMVIEANHELQELVAKLEDI